jgi:uncharacterized protein YjbI with pentapeptide repeats
MFKNISLRDIMKFLGATLGAIALFIPLWTGIIQYKQYNKQKLDENFRNTIKKLSSVNKEDRLAASSSLGTFLNQEDYYKETIDILINRLSVELDYNVLSAILGSLKNVKKEEYRKVINNILAINRNFFIQEYVLKKWRDEAKKAFKETEAMFIQREDLYKLYSLEVDKTMLDILKEELEQKYEDSNNLIKSYDELAMKKQTSADFISSFLGMITKTHPMSVEFNQNSLNYVIVTDINLSNSIIKRSALSSSTILDTIFDHSKIIDTVFTGSVLTKSSFRKCKIYFSLFDDTILEEVDFYGSEFRDVFFATSDLTGTNFRSLRGLDAINFYEAKNIDKASFDPDFKDKLAKLENITENEFLDYVHKTKLSPSRKDTLFETIDLLRQRYNYFVNAAILYIWKDDRNAQVAAIASINVAAKVTIKSMNGYIDKLEKNIDKLEKILLNKKPDLINRLSELNSEILSKKEWSIDRVKELKKDLMELDPEYLYALEKGDPDIFIRRYPDLSEIFKKLKEVGDKG